MRIQLMVFSFLLANVTSAFGNCIFGKYLLDNEWRLILKFEKNNLQLLREQNVENGTVLFLVCNNNDITEVRCVNGEFSTQLPLAPCVNYIRPQLRLENDRNLCEYNLYHLGYEIVFQGRDYFLETYMVCFEYGRKRAVFAINEAYPFVKSRPRGMQFDPDEIFTMNIFSAYNKREIHSQFNRILGGSQIFMPNNAGDERFDRGHLAPAGDYFTNNLIASTFKMINVIPQFHSINAGNWKLMEEWVRHPINTPARVCSGAFYWILQLSDTSGNLREMYLREDLIPIPLWTFKIVLNRGGVRTVFLQYNNIHERQMRPQIPEGLCQETSCPSTIRLKRSYSDGYTFCCDPVYFMDNCVQNLKGYC